MINHTSLWKYGRGVLPLVDRGNGRANKADERIKSAQERASAFVSVRIKEGGTAAVVA